MRTRWNRSAPFAMVSVLVCAATACSGSSEPAADTVTDSTAEVTAEVTAVATAPAASIETAPVVADVEPLSVGIVAPSASDDVAFTQSMVDSIDRVGASRPLDVSIVNAPDDAAAAIRGFAEEGVDLVIAHGSQYGGSLQEVAPDFPDVAFAWGTAADTFGLPNVSAYTVRADEGGFVNGVMAAQLTTSNSLGVVGPVEIGDAKLYIDGFRAGVAAQNPDARVRVEYIDSFSDVTLASEAARALIDNGADVLTGTAQMVVGATVEANSAGVPWFGTQSDQRALGAGIVVASQVYRWDVMLNELFDSIEAGSLGGEVYTLTMENGGLVIEFNDGFPLDAGIKASGEATLAGLIGGSITTGVE